MNNDVVVIIMAGGLGKRMETDIPKVLMKVGGIPMIVRILIQLKYLKRLVKLEKIMIVVGKYKDQIKSVIDKYIDLLEIEYVLQEEAQGTGHAVMCCKQTLTNYPKANVLILSGDVPMLSADTMKMLLDLNSEVKLVTTFLDNPSGYGRIVFKQSKFDKIVEHKDCNEEQLKIIQVNCGIYCIKSDLLTNNFKYLKNDNKQKEYYLTDIIEIIKREEQIEVDVLNISSEKKYEIIGVNTSQQLKELDNLIKNKIE
jgi:UDP-N-acetylglucosamine diphosphorylase/glucosamine-1-phosphate N-acetyltransferase